MSVNKIKGIIIFQMSFKYSLDLLEAMKELIHQKEIIKILFNWGCQSKKSTKCF